MQTKTANQSPKNIARKNRNINNIFLIIILQNIFEYFIISFEYLFEYKFINKKEDAHTRDIKMNIITHLLVRRTQKNNYQYVEERTDKQVNV